jgi:O-antigen/teichoic acid export membrane protein
MNPAFEHDVSRAWSWITKGSSLFMVSALELGTPFVRMIVLARFLSLSEVGFASALAATYAMLEQTTDIAIHRFVFSSPPDKFNTTLATAHGLSVLRGLSVGVFAVAAAPFVAALLSLEADWTIFAALGAIVIVRSFENLAPRVAERNYQFGAQFRMNVVAGLLSLFALGVTVYLRRDHTAIVMSLLGHAIGIVVTSHVVADVPYRIRFRTPQSSKAMRFAYPLMLNGVGLALAGQGDRFLVGSMLGLQTLGIYSIVLLVTVVPITMVFRNMGTLNLAAYHNASAPGALQTRMRLAARLSPLVATVYSLSILALMNVATPAVFGGRFMLAKTPLCLLAFAAFVRIIRVEPSTSLLLHEQRTKRLAVGNLAVISSLAFAYVLISVQPTLEAGLGGRLLGEATGLIVTVVVARKALADSLGDYARSISIGLLIVCAAGVGVWNSAPESGLWRGLAMLMLSAIVIAPWGLSLFPAVQRRAIVARLVHGRPYSTPNRTD